MRDGVDLIMRKCASFIRSARQLQAPSAPHCDSNVRATATRQVVLHPLTKLGPSFHQEDGMERRMAFCKESWMEMLLVR